jgi:hypothetical protein
VIKKFLLKNDPVTDRRLQFFYRNKTKLWLYLQSKFEKEGIIGNMSPSTPPPIHPIRRQNKRKQSNPTRTASAKSPRTMIQTRGGRFVQPYVKWIDDVLESLNRHPEIKASKNPQIKKIIKLFQSWKLPEKEDILIKMYHDHGEGDIMIQRILAIARE